MDRCRCLWSPSNGPRWDPPALLLPSTAESRHEQLPGGGPLAGMALVGGGGALLLGLAPLVDGVSRTDPVLDCRWPSPTPSRQRPTSGGSCDAWMPRRPGTASGRGRSRTACGKNLRAGVADRAWLGDLDVVGQERHELGSRALPQPIDRWMPPAPRLAAHVEPRIGRPALTGPGGPSGGTGGGSQSWGPTSRKVLRPTVIAPSVTCTCSLRGPTAHPREPGSCTAWTTAPCIGATPPTGR